MTIRTCVLAYSLVSVNDVVKVLNLFAFLFGKRKCDRSREAFHLADDLFKIAKFDVGSRHAPLQNGAAGRYDEGVQSYIETVPVRAGLFRLKTDCNGEHMPHPGDNVHIPLKFDTALRGLLKVKPTADMPRPGAQPSGAKKKRAKKAK